MKGTLFSADFVTDSSQELRLLELNTDTAVLNSKIDDINLSSFITVLQNNSITKLDIIYKPTLHNKLVEKIQSIISSDASFITAVTLHDEDVNTIYPSAVTDASDKFILRIAYDEGAVLDSTYAKNRLNVFNLFTDANINDYTVAYYHSSSDGVVNTLTNELNPSNVPDATIKDVDESFNPIDFFKIGSETSGESISDRWSAFVNENKAGDKLIEQFHYHSSSLSGNKVTSVRNFSIVYGSSLDTVNILSYKIPAIFELPADISSEVDNAQYSSKIKDKHFFEYATNFIKHDSAGLLSTTKILMDDDSWEALSTVEVGDTIQSYFISGSPQVEGDKETLGWSSAGKDFPTGSFVTSSDVVYKDTRDLKYKGLIEIKVDNDSLFSGVNKQFLVYDSGSDVMRFKHSTALDPDNDYFYDISGSLIDLDEANFYITSDDNLSFVDLDVEDTDTYIISGSTAFHSIVSHNAPCFVAGTKIVMADGTSKNIEDVANGEEVKTYNFTKGYTENKKVTATGIKNVPAIVNYSFADGNALSATLDHPMYSPTHGWVSYDPEFTGAMYGLTVKMVKEGMEIQKYDGSVSPISSIEYAEEKTKVYNLRNVDTNHNFYANEFLVHNRCFVAGTEILLANGDVKNIEDIEVGEEVLTFNLDTNSTEAGQVGELKKHDVKGVVQINLEGISITCTPEHPFYTNGEWVNAGDLKEGDVCLNSVGEEVVVTKVISSPLAEVEVFNLLNVSDNHNFYANGILVHNK